MRVKRNAQVVDNAIVLMFKNDHNQFLGGYGKRKILWHKTSAKNSYCWKSFIEAEEHAKKNPELNLVAVLLELSVDFNDYI